MNKLFKSIFLLVVCLSFLGGKAFGDFLARDLKYAITITNVTRSQIFSPPVVITHTKNYELISPGKPASSELAALAEDGMTMPLTDELDTLPSVYDYAVGEGVILPGDSSTVHVSSRGIFSYLSIAGMLVTTNDAFFGLRNTRIPRAGDFMRNAVAYDAGSEANTENCDFIPGPPCENPGERDTAGAEGYVHVHAGIQGIGDLPSEEFDWNNPVAVIRIRSVR
jgi:hypothetical protein